MEPLYTIATLRRREMERTASTERLAAELRRARPRRSPVAAFERVVARIRDTGTAMGAEPCPTC